MTLGTSFSMAFKALGGNKMRSFLTMLGIIIGVLAITLLVSLVQSASSEITGQVSDMGSNLLTVSINAAKPIYIPLSELENFSDDALSGIAPVVSASSSVKAEGNGIRASVTGSTAYYTSIRNMPIEFGRSISALDVEAYNAVAVIGVGVADDLFGQRNVLGETVTVAGRDFRVVGLFEEEGQTMLGSRDDMVLIPYTTAQRLLKQTTLRTIYASASDNESVFEAENALKAFLMPYVKDEDSLLIFSQTSLLDALSTMMATMSLLLGGIAGISLLVGGIGIMNIMLVSVTERTREIGIRKAIGAKRRNILTQFLIEAIVLSLIGGLIGLGIGYIAGAVLTGLMGLQINISASVAAIAVGFSLAVGVGFGVYPASKASKMRPIEALHYE